MRRPTRSLVPVLALAATAAACSTVSEHPHPDCPDATIGLRDGTRGRFQKAVPGMNELCMVRVGVKNEDGSSQAGFMQVIASPESAAALLPKLNGARDFRAAVVAVLDHDREGLYEIEIDGAERSGSENVDREQFPFADAERITVTVSRSVRIAVDPYHFANASHDDEEEKARRDETVDALQGLGFDERFHDGEYYMYANHLALLRAAGYATSELHNYDKSPHAAEVADDVALHNRVARSYLRLRQHSTEYYVGQSAECGFGGEKRYPHWIRRGRDGRYDTQKGGWREDEFLYRPGGDARNIPLFDLAFPDLGGQRFGTLREFILDRSILRACTTMVKNPSAATPLAPSSWTKEAPKEPEARTERDTVMASFAPTRMSDDTGTRTRTLPRSGTMPDKPMEPETSFPNTAEGIRTILALGPNTTPAEIRSTFKALFTNRNLRDFTEDTQAQGRRLRYDRAPRAVQTVAWKGEIHHLRSALGQKKYELLKRATEALNGYDSYRYGAERGAAARPE